MRHDLVFQKMKFVPYHEMTPEVFDNGMEKLVKNPFSIENVSWLFKKRVVKDEEIQDG